MFFMFAPRKKIKPLKTIPFNQANLIFINNIAGGSKSPLNWTGVCYALTKAWYEHLGSKRSLIEELGLGLATDKDLIFKISQWQKKTSGDIVRLHMEINPHEDEKESIKDMQKINPGIVVHDDLDEEKEIIKHLGEKEYKELVTKMTPVESILSDLDFSEAITGTYQGAFGLLGHLNRLDEHHRSNVGFHVISICDLQSGKGHMIGWTFHNDNFILFDSNKGEMYFGNNFELFRDFLYDYVQSIFPNYKERIYSVSDFYKSIDLKQKHDIGKLNRGC